MTAIIEQIDQLFKEKGLPLERRQAPDGNHVYTGVFSKPDAKPISFNIVIQNAEDIADFQIVYGELAYATDYAKKPAVLEMLNELNMYKTGYYTAVLAGDGEIFVKCVSRVAKENVFPLYEMLVIGSNMSLALLPEIEKALA